MHNIFKNSPCLRTPIGLSQYLALTILPVLSAVKGNTSTPIYILLTELNDFTLSYYGSNSLLSTLKPNLTTSAPRLNTSDLLGLTRFGLAPN